MKHLVKRAQEILASEGAGVLFQRIALRLSKSLGISHVENYDHGYHRWLENYESPAGKSVNGDQNPPILISIIVPVYNVDPKWLQAAVESVRNQSWTRWQLCIVDDASTRADLLDYLEGLQGSDPRIAVKISASNQGISATSNTALEMAEGDFIGLLDHDDLLSTHALQRSIDAILENPSVDLTYSDEDKISVGGIRNTPFFKPDYSPELLLGQNYIGHFVVVRKGLLEEVGGFRSEFDGAQDYDLLLRLSRKVRVVKHIPEILYHWREIPGSTAQAFGSKSYAHEAGRRALEACFSESGTDSPKVADGKHPGTYRTDFPVRADPEDLPMISVILPFRDQAVLLQNCLESVFTRTEWPNLEVIAINNNSQSPDTLNLINRWTDDSRPVRFVDYPEPFNYSRICNQGVEIAKGQYIVLLNSDIEITSSQWVEQLLGWAAQDEIGAVGAKLLYPDHTIQHAGIVVGIDDGAGHPYKHFPENSRGYFMRLDLVHNVSAVTGALMMVSRQKYIQAGGLDETDFAVAYNDVDFCLKLMAAGYRNVLNPHCRAIHFESRTRGYDAETDKQQRHDAEKQRLRQKWRDLFDSGDPYYNPNLTLAREDYSLNFSRKQPGQQSN